MSSKTITYNGIGFPSLLFIAFLVLKLCNVINWSWWWVTAPLWISAGFSILVLMIAVFILIICHILK